MKRVFFFSVCVCSFALAGCPNDVAEGEGEGEEGEGEEGEGEEGEGEEGEGEEGEGEEGEGEEGEGEEGEGEEGEGEGEGEGEPPASLTVLLIGNSQLGGFEAPNPSQASDVTVGLEDF